MRWCWPVTAGSTRRRISFASSRRSTCSPARNPRLHLVLAGPCTVPEYLEALDRRIAASPFAARIHRLGAIESGGPGLPDAYHGCDIFVLPSRHEPFGIVVLEAWSAGKPVIAANVGGLRNLVRDGVNGFLSPGADAGAMAARIGQLADSAELRAQFGRAGRALAIESYTWEKIAGETERIYQAAEARSSGRDIANEKRLIPTAAK